MFRYSWKYLYKYCNKDVDTIISVLETYLEKQHNKRKNELKIIYKLSKMDKPAYIKDLKGLLEAKATNNEKVIYLYVASKRNVLDYLLYDKEYLHIGLVDLDHNKLKHNPLFVFKNNYVYFKY